jgi:plasmid stabilization system protein ParE
VRVRADIQETLDDLAEHPRMGRSIEGRNRRLQVTPRFGYLIYYQIDRIGISVSAIRHPARKRLFD